jgi:hypothetical protein
MNIRCCVINLSFQICCSVPWDAEGFTLFRPLLLPLPSFLSSNELQTFFWNYCLIKASSNTHRLYWPAYVQITKRWYSDLSERLRPSSFPDIHTYNLFVVKIIRGNNIPRTQEEKLQEVISYVFVINKVHINKCPILDGYGVMTASLFPYTPLCEPRLLSERPPYLDTWAVAKVCGERRGGLGSQPSGGLCWGRRWHFRKSDLSTDKFKFNFTFIL